eukprot:TRINITY_DN986_c0_g1_i1.p1 TRINITY_DN986_c0_g1~~TRINITY_DN986_c0_g1_i1.p1  ORF type:complete len:455 (-),score=57.68 TRINITY_DN986_c0_g1_i1:57-1421(-)
MNVAIVTWLLTSTCCVQNVSFVLAFVIGGDGADREGDDFEQCYDRKYETKRTNHKAEGRFRRKDVQETKTWHRHGKGSMIKWDLESRADDAVKVRNRQGKGSVAESALFDGLLAGIDDSGHKKRSLHGKGSMIKGDLESRADDAVKVRNRQGKGSVAESALFDGLLAGIDDSGHKKRSSHGKGTLMEMPSSDGYGGVDGVDIPNFRDFFPDGDSDGVGGEDRSLHQKRGVQRRKLMSIERSLLRRRHRPRGDVADPGELDLHGRPDRVDTPRLQKNVFDSLIGRDKSPGDTLGRRHGKGSPEIKALSRRKRRHKRDNFDADFDGLLGGGDRSKDGKRDRHGKGAVGKVASQGRGVKGTGTRKAMLRMARHFPTLQDYPSVGGKDTSGGSHLEHTHKVHNVGIAISDGDGKALANIFRSRQHRRPRSDGRRRFARTVREGVIGVDRPGPGGWQVN